jgi:hypothetical protein
MEDIIYDENTEKRLHLELYKDGELVQDLSEYVSSFNEKFYFDTADTFKLIGQFSSREYALTVDNSYKFIDSKNLLNYEFKVYYELINDENSTYIDENYFKIYNAPERFTDTLTITGNDNACLFDVYYTSELDYTSGNITIKDQLEEMKSIVGIDIDYSNVDESILNKAVTTIDTTSTCRSYIKWIAELNCSNAIANGNTVVFKPLYTESQYEVSLEGTSDLYKGEEYEITGVSFNLAELLVYEAGTDDGNVYSLDTTNRYILSQDEVDFIYSKMKGLKMISFETLHMVHGNPLIQVGDMVSFMNEETTDDEGETVEAELNFIGLVLSNSTTFYGGFVTDLDGKITSQLSSQLTSGDSQEVTNRKTELKIEKIDDTLAIQSQKIDSLQEQTAKLTIAYDGIDQLVTEKITEEVENIQVGAENLLNGTLTQDTSYGNLQENVISTTDTYKGANIFKSNLANANIGFDFIQQILNNNLASAGDELTYSIYVKTDSETPLDIKIYLKKRDGDEYFVDGNIVSTISKGDWKQIKYTFTLTDEMVNIESDDSEEDNEEETESLISTQSDEDEDIDEGYYDDTDTDIDEGDEDDTDDNGEEETVINPLQYVMFAYDSTILNGAFIYWSCPKLELGNVATDYSQSNVDTTVLRDRISSAEEKLTATQWGIWFTETINNGEAVSTNFTADKDGIHVVNGGIDVSNNAGEKTLYADSDGNLVINNLTANSGVFNGIINAVSGNIGQFSITSNGLENYVYTEIPSIYNIFTNGKISKSLYIKYYKVSTNDNDSGYVYKVNSSKNSDSFSIIIDKSSKYYNYFDEDNYPKFSISIEYLKIVLKDDDTVAKELNSSYFENANFSIQYEIDESTYTYSEDSYGKHFSFKYYEYIVTKEDCGDSVSIFGLLEDDLSSDYEYYEKSNAIVNISYKRKDKFVHIGYDGIQLGENFSIDESGNLKTLNDIYVGNKIYVGEQTGSEDLKGIFFTENMFITKTTGDEAGSTGDFLNIVSDQGDIYIRSDNMRINMVGDMLELTTAEVNLDDETSYRSYIRLTSEGVDLSAKDGMGYLSVSEELVKIYKDLKVDSNIKAGNNLYADTSIYAGGKTAMADGLTGGGISNTGNLYLTSESSPFLYFYRENSKTITHSIGVRADDFYFSKGITTSGSISSHGYNVLTKVISVSQDNVSVSKSSNVTVTISASETNWSPIGVICCSLGNASSSGALATNCNAYSYYYSGTNAVANIHNFNTSSDAKVKVTMYVLMRYSG